MAKRHNKAFQRYLCRRLLAILILVGSALLTWEMWLVHEDLPTISRRVWNLTEAYPPLGFIGGALVVFAVAMIAHYCYRFRWSAWAAMIIGLLAGHFWWQKGDKE